MAKKTVETAKADIATALEDAYKADGATYAKKLKQTRKHLPRKVTKQAEYLLEAEQKLKHPKQRKFVDQARVQAARKAVLRSTHGVDIDRDRSLARFGWASGLVLRLIIAMALIFGFAYYVGAF